MVILNGIFKRKLYVILDFELLNSNDFVNLYGDYSYLMLF